MQIEDLDRPIVLKDKDMMITADWHVPLCDNPYIDYMLNTAESYYMKDLVIAGDFFNFDQLSHYEPKQESANMTRELKAGVALMRKMLDQFNHIYYIWGNHDYRFHRALGHGIKFADAMRLLFGELGSELLARITFSNLDHLWVTHGKRRIYICHPANYSKIALATPKQLAAKHNASVVCAHAHHAAIGYAMNGKDVVVEAGGLFDRKKTAYLQRSTTYPHWTQGFTMILDEQLVLSSPEFSAGIM